MATRASLAFGGVLHVERDGSGDFLTIQEAVDAAASGDTILIGPGRYDEGQVVSTPGWSDFVRVLVNHEELSIFGSGVDSTIIGPVENFDYSQERHRGIVAGQWFGCHRLNIKDITFHGMWYGIGGAPAADLTVEQCKFSGNEVGIYSVLGGELIVSGSQFEEISEFGMQLYANSTGFINVTRCNFTMRESVLPGTYEIGAQFDATGSINMMGCNFLHGRVGIAISGAIGSTAAISDCHFYGQDVVSLRNIGTSSHVQGCTFSGSDAGIFLEGDFPFVMRDSEFSDVRAYSLGFTFVGGVSVNRCSLSRGDLFTVVQVGEKKSPLELPALDLRENFWGTSSVDSVDAWINVRDYEYEYIPIIWNGVDEKKSTLGGIKSLFRE